MPAFSVYEIDPWSGVTAAAFSLMGGWIKTVLRIDLSKKNILYDSHKVECKYKVKLLSKISGLMSRVYVTVRSDFV